MDRLRAIADAHYRAGPPQVKTLACEFFKALDTDGDGRVSLAEFLAFMTQQGYTGLNNPRVFKELDRDGNGSLDFWEVLTLYYIVKSGRPLCNCCGILIPGTFFSCVECFESLGSYSLCIYCYRSNKSKHHHNGRQQFLDTFTLLEMKKNAAIRGKTNQNQQTIWHSTSHFMVPLPPAPAPAPTHIHINVGHPMSPTPQAPNAVQAAKTNKWKAALTAFEVALSIGSISTTLCTIL